MNKLYQLDSKLQTAFQERVWLKSGGYLVIQPTEALTVIDVNSGKYEAKRKAEEEYILKLNREAAEEIAIQLRLRNLSGIIIVDFIRGKNKFNDAKFEISKKRNLSFLEEVERINVAISRAKSKLIILGAFTGYLNERSIKDYGYLFKKYYDECKDLDSSYCLFK